MWMQAVGVGRPVAPRWRLRPLMPERGDNHRKVFPPVLNPDPGQGPGISPSRRITARASRRHPIRWIASSQTRQSVVPVCEVPRLPPCARPLSACMTRQEHPPTTAVLFCLASAPLGQRAPQRGSGARARSSRRTGEGWRGVVSVSSARVGRGLRGTGARE